MNAIVPCRNFAIDIPATTRAPRGDSRKPGLLRRLFDAFARAQHRRADREVARVFGGRLGEDGIRLTDQLERKLADHFAPKGGFQP